MATIAYARRKNSSVLWARTLAVAVVLFPLSIHHVDYRATFTQGLSVSAHKASPAYAAFEDLRENYTSDMPLIPEHGELLASGQSFEPKIQAAVPQLRQITLKGMTIRQPALLEPKPVLIAAYSARREVTTVIPAFQDTGGQLLPLAERKRRLVDQLRAEDFSQPSPGALAAQLAEQALGESIPGGQLLRSHTGHPILIRKTTGLELPSPQKDLVADLIRGLDRQQVASNDGAESFATLGLHNPDPANMRPLWLTGQVEMTGGLAFVGPETQIVVKRVFNGQNFEQGRIWVTEGKFEIRVKQPSGFLVAELRTRDGRVLGHGEINLLDITDLPKDDRIGDLRIALRPTTEGATLHAISGYSSGNQKIAVADSRIEIQAYTDPQKVNEEGFVNEPTLNRNSSFVARALAKNHWPTLIVGQAREPQDIRLFANSMVDALVSLNVERSGRKEALQQSIVWGRVQQNGRAVHDAQVELATGLRPIYFNEAYLPDPQLTGTTANGLFAFVNVKAGVQALRVKILNHSYPAQIFPAEEKHVSYIELDVHDKVIAQFKVFDALDMRKAVVARVRLVGSEAALTVGKDDFVEFSAAANPLMVEADAGVEFEVSRVTVTGLPHVVHIPLVQREWLYRLAASKGIQPSPSLGTVVGFMDEQDFEVELTGYNPGQSSQIIYFDAQGRALESKTGVAGGGFVIYNAPSGLQTLYIHPTQSRETFSQVIVAEPEFVQVVTH